MTAVDAEEQIYVVPVSRVTDSIQTLLSRDIHPWFMAYLHLKRQSALQGTTNGIRPDWAELSEVLYVSGGPPKKPHLRPFWSGARRANQEWLNENLAGSYAPSSIRGLPFHVVEVDAQRRFVLKENHAQLARQYLLADIPLPVIPLAAFLFRDRGIISNEPPDERNLIDVFRQTYGYRSDTGSDEFAILFDLDLSGQDDAPWLEPWSGAVEQGPA